jgi:hypothetical protein
MLRPPLWAILLGILATASGAHVWDRSETCGILGGSMALAFSVAESERSRKRE